MCVSVWCLNVCPNPYLWMFCTYLFSYDLYINADNGGLNILHTVRYTSRLLVNGVIKYIALTDLNMRFMQYVFAK